MAKANTTTMTFLRKNLTPRKILFYTIFHGIHVFLFIIGWWAQANNTQLAALNSLHFSVWISRGAALVLTFDITLILLPMCKNLMSWLRPKARWLPLDETQFFHRQVAYTMLFWVVVHVVSHYINFFNIEKTQIRPLAAAQLQYTSAGGITGHIMLLCMLLIFTTSHARIRQQSFETFWYTHHLFVPFLLAMYTHATGCFVRNSTDPVSPFAGQQFWDHCVGYEGWRWELVAFAVYLGERVWRECRSRRETEIVRVIKHPYDAFEIQFRKPSFRYIPGQYLYLNVPSVFPHQWHPFTITSCPFDSHISIHIRQVGDFTRALASALGAGDAQKDLYEELDPAGLYQVTLGEGEAMPKIRVDGPYGAPAEDVLDNEVAVLIGTGIGVTPWASILKHIHQLRQMSQQNPNQAPLRLRQVEFIWVCRDTTSFEWFRDLLLNLEEQSSLTDKDGVKFLKIHIHLTQRLDADTAQNIVLNSVGTAEDPLTRLNERTNFGRPDFGKMLGGMRDSIMRGGYPVAGGNGRLEVGTGKRTTVGVYFCGPNAAAREIQKACKGATCEGVRFRFWKEHF